MTTTIYILAALIGTTMVVLSFLKRYLQRRPKRAKPPSQIIHQVVVNANGDATIKLIANQVCVAMFAANAGTTVFTFPESLMIDSEEILEVVAENTSEPVEVEVQMVYRALL